MSDPVVEAATPTGAENFDAAAAQAAFTAGVDQQDAPEPATTVPLTPVVPALPPADVEPSVDVDPATQADASSAPSAEPGPTASGDEEGTQPPGAPEPDPGSVDASSEQDSKDAKLEALPINDQIIAGARNAIGLLRDAVSSVEEDFSTPEAKQQAEAFLAAYKDIPDVESIDVASIDVKAMLSALDGLSYSGQTKMAEAMANVKKTQEVLSQNTQITSGGETHTIDEWKSMAVDDSDSVRQDSAKAALKDGVYALKFEPDPKTSTPAEAAPAPEKGKEKDIRVQMDEDLTQQAKAIDKKLEDKSLSKEDRAKLESQRDLIRLALKEAKGDERAAILAGLIREAKNAGFGEITEETMARYGLEETRAIEEIVRHLKQIGRHSDTSAEALKIAIRSGDVREFLKYGSIDTEVAKMVLGKDFKDNEAVKKYVDNILTPEQRAKLMKKGMKGMGLLAILLIMGSAVFGNTIGEATFKQ